jgi:hypothetical protein
MPEISDNILLFHRGLDVVTLKGYFLGEKADLLIGMAVREPLAAMWAWMTGRGCARGVASHSPTTNSASEGLDSRPAIAFSSHPLSLPLLPPSCLGCL